VQDHQRRVEFDANGAGVPGISDTNRVDVLVEADDDRAADEPQ